MTDDPTPFTEWPRLSRRVVVFVTPLDANARPIADRIVSFTAVAPVDLRRGLTLRIIDSHNERREP